MPRFTDRLPHATKLKLGAAALLAIGVAGGAGAVSLTRPSIEMAPTTPTAIARLATTDGVVTVKGRVAEVYGDRFVLQDGTGRTMIDAGRDAKAVSAGTAMTVQGRYANGQVRASYLVDPAGRIDAVGPAGGRPPHRPEGPAGPGGPGHDGPNAGPPRPPQGGPGDRSPNDRGPDDRGPADRGPQAGCAPAPVAGAVQPTPVVGDRPSAPVTVAPRAAIRPAVAPAQ